MIMNKKEEDRKQEENRKEKRAGKEKSPRDKSDMVKETLSFILYIAIVFLVTYLVIHYVGQRTQVSGTSMEYTLSDGDNLIVDKISYRFHDPERFDIIVFPFSTKKILIISRGLSACREKRYRLMTKGIFILTGKCWRNPTEERLF